MVEGAETVTWPRASLPRKQTVRFWLQAWQGLGGAAALSRQATLYLLKQLEELASNRDQQPVYIQWNATAQPGAPLNATELHDGWYIIDSLAPNYSKFVVSGIVECTMTVTEVAAAPPRTVAMSYTGGALSSNFLGGALNLLSLPVGSTALEASFTRTGAEGAIPCILSPAASPEPTVLSATIANWFKGGVHVYDTINTGSNPVPTSGGTFINANWVEVFFTDHDFVGDCVITNGFQLLLLATGSSQVATCYLWNTALAVANWQQYGTLNYFDNTGGAGVLRSYSLVRVGAEESAISILAGGSNSAQIVLRLQRGRLEFRVDFRPLSQANTTDAALRLLFASTSKIGYTESGIEDSPVLASTLGASSTYGYGANFAANTSFPLILGWLYQNQPAFQIDPGGAGSQIDFGDNTSLAINAQRSYGFFAVPYGVSGTYSPANLQQEVESGALGTGWSNVADGLASGGHAAKCASGTLANNEVDAPASPGFQAAAGTYDAWIRAKVTSNVGSAVEMVAGIFDSTAASFLGSTNLNRTSLTTSYAWYRVGTGVTVVAGHTNFFVIKTLLTLGTDWFIDEAALVPKTLTAANTGPQDIWQQFMYDRSTKLIRP